MANPGLGRKTTPPVERSATKLAKRAGGVVKAHFLPKEMLYHGELAT